MDDEILVDEFQPVYQLFANIQTPFIVIIGLVRFMTY